MILSIAWLKPDISIADIPTFKVALAIVVVTLAQILRKLFSAIIIKSLEDATSKTETEIDDELIAILKQPLNWSIVIAGVWIAKLILIGELNPSINKTFDSLISLALTAIIAWTIFRASPLLGRILGNLALNTKTELDDLIVPYIPKLFQALAIAIFVLKAGEVLLGASAGALIGLVGGTGITLGLLLKDIVYDWFCTIIIFSDRIYRIDDILKVGGIDKLVRVKNIGIRSTTLCNLSQNTLIKLPNSKMITGIVENWSQNPDAEDLLGIHMTLQIDDISAEQTARICQTINGFPQEIDGLSDRFMVWFSRINQNARTIEIQAFAKTNDLKIHRAICNEINLGILKIMERENIELFSSTPIAILPSEAEIQIPVELDRDRTYSLQE